MKKYFLFSAMAAVALASCTNDDVVDVNKGGGISFRASLDKARTKAVTTLSNLGAFNVTAMVMAAIISRIWESPLLIMGLLGQLRPFIIGQVMDSLFSRMRLKRQVAQ
ncbi:hypothetical protein ACIXMN_06400 [Bacteroides fragilis]